MVFILLLKSMYVWSIFLFLLGMWNINDYHHCFLSNSDEEVENLTVRKIPRPPNAFMLFANANRKMMAQRFPTESNKDISKRLGSSWKSLEVSEKNKYFDKAKMIDNEHKIKYPSEYWLLRLCQQSSLKNRNELSICMILVGETWQSCNNFYFREWIILVQFLLLPLQSPKSIKVLWFLRKSTNTSTVAILLSRK